MLWIFGLVFTAILFTLKLLGVLQVSWLVVSLPLLIPVLLGLVLMGVLVNMGSTGFRRNLFGNRNRKKGWRQ